MRPCVMVVDDSPVVREQVKSTLDPAGFDVLEATDGIDAFEKLHAQKNIAVVLCDVRMPRMSGVELVTCMRSIGCTDLPIIMMTADDPATEILGAKEAGARGWLPKTSAPPILVAAVKKLATARRSR